MTPFIHDDFLLQSPTAVRLYHEFAAKMPIIDYHSHLSPKIMAENACFANITEAWLQGDHYKWRAMRAAGVDEQYITGNAVDREKFQAWAETVPKTLRNPLYHWTHLELRRPFGIDDVLLGPETAGDVWDRANEMLEDDDFAPLEILKKMDVKILCTTDDPVDSLEFHKRIASEGKTKIEVFPTFRPDRFVSIPGIAPNGSREIGQRILLYNRHLDILGEAAGIDITRYETFLEALRKRHDYFHSFGARLSDHGFEQFEYETGDPREISVTFDMIRSCHEISPTAIVRFQSAVLHEIALWNQERGWTMQMHLGALRNNNLRYFKRLGPDAGFDSIGDSQPARPLGRFMDELDSIERLPKMVLYNLNPVDNEMLATMAGNFQDGDVPGKIQFGSGWWFLDQKDGMERQLNALSNLGLLSKFVGMLTDSRSFLSFTRHEYFRRILCNLIGGEVDAGLLPNEPELIGSMIQDICYHNAENYFKFE